jgi:hypothetical protein
MVAPSEVDNEIATVTVEVVKEVEVTEIEATAAPAAQEPTSTSDFTSQPTALPKATATPWPTQVPESGNATEDVLRPTEAPQNEARVLELEWPPRMRLGDSDVIRLSLIPSADGYSVRTDFPEHKTVTQTLQIDRAPGYDLVAAADLEGVGFEIAPEEEQSALINPNQEVTFQWSLQPLRAGQQRAIVSLVLRWVPQAGMNAVARESTVYSRALNIEVVSFFGMNRSQAMTSGLFGVLVGSGLLLAGLFYQPGGMGAILEIVRPNPNLSIEPPPGLIVSPTETALLRALFTRYSRLILESEFLSGYSGARTFLARPLQADGRADAHTIIKIGDRLAVQQEYANYEQFVKDTLPPVTARIQRAPVSVTGSSRAAVQYTFIGTPAQPPRSLRLALLERPDRELLDTLFETFGPNWWMQRRPYAFRLAYEYDRVLPTHFVIEPIEGRGRASVVLDGRTAPDEAMLQVGDVVQLSGFPIQERRADGRSLSLLGHATRGRAAMRVRWLSLKNPNYAIGRVTATRASLLAGWTAGFDRYGLPDPLLPLADILSESLTGSQSIIHGDLNLENILVGPGGFVWLIDFAMTREGHALFDFAHLGASLIADVIAPQVASPGDYLAVLNERPFEGGPEGIDRVSPLAGLLAELNRIAGQCLANPTRPQEFQRVLYLACLGALKYENLDRHARHLLYLTAAHLLGE